MIIIMYIYHALINALSVAKTGYVTCMNTRGFELTNHLVFQITTTLSRTAVVSICSKNKLSSGLRTTPSTLARKRSHPRQHPWRRLATERRRHRLWRHQRRPRQARPPQQPDLVDCCWLCPAYLQSTVTLWREDCFLTSQWRISLDPCSRKRGTETNEIRMLQKRREKNAPKNVRKTGNIS